MAFGATICLAADAFAVLLLVAVLCLWGRSRPAVRSDTIAGLVSVGLVLAAALVLVRPASIEPGWITVLHEGRSSRNIGQLYGQTAHAGPLFQAFVDSVSRGDASTLAAVVRMNLALAAFNTTLFFFLAARALRSRVAALAFAIVYAGNLNTIHAACSETPAMLWTAHLWLACIAGAVIGDDAATDRLRQTAFACAALLAAAAAMIRGELVLVGAPALAVAAARVFGGERVLQGGARSIVRLVRSIFSLPLPALVLLVAGLLLLEVTVPKGRWSYVAASLSPVNLSFALLPQKLAMFLPLAVILLFVLGLVHAMRHWASFLLFPFTLLALFKAYAAGAQGNLEHFRYLTFVTPGVFFLALFGFRELAGWAERRRWPAWWKRAAVTVLLLGTGVWQPLGPRELFAGRHELVGVHTPLPLLARNQQTEVRYLLQLVERYPDCEFVAKVSRASTGADGYRWVVFGAASGPRELPDGGGDLDSAARTLAKSSCVLFYHSLDCNLVELGGCEREAAGRAALDRRVLRDLPYSDVLSYGAHRPEIHLGVYAVLPPSSDAARMHGL